MLFAKIAADNLLERIGSEITREKVQLIANIGCTFSYIVLVFLVVLLSSRDTQNFAIETTALKRRDRFLILGVDSTC